MVYKCNSIIIFYYKVCVIYNYLDLKILIVIMKAGLIY